MPSSESAKGNTAILAAATARKKAEEAVKLTERALIKAEQRCSTAIQSRQRADTTVKESIAELRQLEATYNSGCDSLESLCEEYGEVRVEVEVALEEAETALLGANCRSNAALVKLVAAEEEAGSSVLALRQAEMEHNQAVQRLARMLGKKFDRVDIGGEGDGYSRGGVGVVLSADDQASQKTDSTIEDTFQGSADPLGLPRVRAESNTWPELGGSDLLSHPLHKYVQQESARSARAERADPLASPRKHGLLPSVPAATRAGTAHESVRLMGFGRSIKCLGPENKSKEVIFPTETRTLLEALGGTAPVQVACSDQHALLVAESGEVFAWGDASGGRLGFGVDTSQVANPVVAVPVPVESLRGVVITRVSCSSVHSLALTAEGELYAWGQAANGVLGIADTSRLFETKKNVGAFTDRPIKVEGFQGPMTKYRVKTMACSETFNVAVTEGGPCYAWGCVDEGRLGIGEWKDLTLPRDRNKARHCPTPVEIEGLRGQRVARVSCGDSHTLVVTEGGEVLAWGSAEYGKLGVGDVSKLPADAEGRVHSPVPLHVDGLRGMSVVSVSAGHSHSLAATKDGVVYAWGSAEEGKLGQGGLPEEETAAVIDARTKQWWPYCPNPALVHGLRGRVVSQVHCGKLHSIAATSDGEVMGWGLTSGGRLGVGEVGGLDPEVVTAEGMAYLPVQVEGLPWGKVQVATCSSYTLLLFSDVDNMDLAMGGEETPAVLAHLLAMQRAEEFTDVLLKPKDGLPIQAHAVVLSSVPFFKARIEAQECDDDAMWTIDLPSCAHSAVQRTVEHLYTGAFNPGDDVSECLHLLQAAAVLDLQPLIRASARRAESLLTPATVATVWEVAYELDLERLKSKCLRFIIDNYDDCRPEKELTIKDTMRRQPAFFDLVLSALAPGPGAVSKLGRNRERVGGT
mmetsp:Transcript_42394/g.99549  ORF Transcript_42394/g.99549 Transcript_42394/m.99549 type:complete len:916 (+) Transcript_42394:139-2886(+)